MSGSKFDPGTLNRRFMLEAPAETPDGAGGVARTYKTIATLWASIEPVSAREDVAAESPGAAIVHRICIRYRDDVTLRHRLRDGTRIFRIITIRERDRRFLDIDAEERAD